MTSERVPHGPLETGSPAPEHDYACEVCGFKLWRPLWSFEHTALGLYDDARFPGRCLLALRSHSTRFEDLPEETIATLMQDAARAGAALRWAINADRVNYAVLGNTEPHVHVHIIPRQHRIDPVPRRPPWEHPDRATPLAPSQMLAIADRIVEGLSRPT